VNEQWLPDGWRWVTLGEVCEINPRRSASLAGKDNAPTTFVPMAAVDEQSGTMNPEIRPLSEVRKGYTYFEEDDVLFAKITPCMQNGKHAIAQDLIDGFGFGTTEFHVIRPSDFITSKWIHLYIRQPAILELATTFFTGSVGQQRVPKEFLEALEIPLPPIPEQQRIIAILEEQMVDIDAARVAIEAELEAADSLSASYLHEVFESDEAGEWKCVPLIEICKAQGQYGLSLKSSYDETGIPILGMGNIRDGEIVWKSLKYLTAEEAELDKYGLTKGDILFNRTNSAELVGKTAIFDGSREAVFASYLIRFRAKPEQADPHFISAYINSSGRAFIERNMARAIGQVNISASTMHKMPIPLPPLELQLDIVNRWANQLIEVNTISAIAQDRLDAINAMPAAVLRRAFNGEL